MIQKVGISRQYRVAWTWLVWFALVAGTIAPGVFAQSGEVSLTLGDNRIEVDRLAPGATVGETSFLVDNATSLVFDIATTSQTLVTRIVAPDAQIIDENTVQGFGGEFNLIQGSQLFDSPITTVIDAGGLHYVYTLPGMGPGNYVVQFEADPGIQSDVAVITQFFSTSTIGAALLATRNEIVLGEPAVVTAAVFDGSAPLLGAAVSLTLLAPSRATTAFAMHDDGIGVDDAAGDGLYSTEFFPGETGEQILVAEITGSAGGLPFRRQTTGAFSVLPFIGILTGSFTDQGVDDDFDGLFDRLHLDVEVDTQLAGSYQILVRLVNSTGDTVLGSGVATLPIGSGNLGADISAEQIRSLGEDGPYAISSVEVYLMETTEALVFVDGRENFGATQGYQLTDFDRPDLVLSGQISDQAFDDDANGLNDRLVVDVALEVLIAGIYEWSFKLTDSESNEIAVGSRSGFLPAGSASISVEFDGNDIGAAGIDGPYVVADLLLFGAGTSLVATTIGVTQPYLAREFEGFVGLPPVCQDAQPSVVELWPPNHKFRNIEILNVSNPDGGEVAVRITEIRQDEPVTGPGAGMRCPDAMGVGEAIASLRAERNGNGDGRIYHVLFDAENEQGGLCNGEVTVCVPHDRGNGVQCTDQGPLFDSTDNVCQ